jgi:hypothetical protein
LKLESSRPAPSNKSEAFHKRAASYARPFGSVVAPERPGEKRVTLHQDHRRVQRVMLRVRANVYVTLQGKETALEATTMSVSDTGALLILQKGLPADCRLVLEHGQTMERVPCRVTRPPQEMPEGFHITVEFDSPAPKFWGIAFPPSDWRPTD